MSELKSINREVVPVAGAAGVTIANPMVWDVEAAANGDTVHIGWLPADHKLLPEACSVLSEGGAAMTFDVCVEEDANAIVAGRAVANATFARSAVTTYEKCHELGASPVNRKVYLKLSAAPAAAGGQVTVNLVYFAS